MTDILVGADPNGASAALERIGVIEKGQICSTSIVFKSQKQHRKTDR